MDTRRFRGGSLAVVTRYRSLMLLAAVLFAQLLVMAYQLRRQQDVPLVRGAVVYVVAPIQKSLAVAVASLRGVWEGYVYLWGTRRQNQVLNDEVDRLKLENQRLRAQAEQGRRLQVLFDIRQQLPLPTVAAQVLSAGSSETARILMIDKGASHGLKPDLPVLVPDGVVGKVLHVFSDTAQVLLVTDPYSGVASLLEDSRVHGVLKGRNQPDCIMAYVPNGEEVRAGQIVYTSGDDQVFPKGLPLGVVLEARPGPEFQQITVRPLAQLNRLEEVLVILQSGGDVGAFPMNSSSANDADAAEGLENEGNQSPDRAVDGPAHSAGSPAGPGGLTPPAPAIPAGVPPAAGLAPERRPVAPTRQDQPASPPAPAAENVRPAPVPAQQPAPPPPQSSLPPVEPPAVDSPPRLNTTD